MSDDLSSCYTQTINGAPPIRAASLVSKTPLRFPVYAGLFCAFNTVRYFRLMPMIAITTLKIAQIAITVFVSIGNTPFRRCHLKQRSTKQSLYLINWRHLMQYRTCKEFCHSPCS